MKTRAIFWTILAFGCLMLTCSQSTKKSKNLPAAAPPDLEKLLASVAQDSAMLTGYLGFSVREVGKEKQEKIAVLGSKMFNLASCQKAITTATALELLGEDFRFKTELQTDAQDNVYLKGFGDPTLASRIMAGHTPDLDALMQTFWQELKAKGLQTVNQVIADETAWNFDVTPSHWIWSDMGNYYGAPAYALNALDNTFELTFQPTQVGKLANIVGTTPALPDVQFINEVRTAPAETGDQASIAGGSYERVRYASGTIPMGFQRFSIKGAMPEPAYFLVWRFTQFLRAQGVQVKQEPTTTRRMALAGKSPVVDRQVVYTHYSPALSLICDYVNFYSVNVFAEAILNQIGAKFPSNKPDNTPLRAGIGKTKEFWAKRGIERAYFYMLDGSGLSVGNGISPSQMSLLLCEAQELASSKAFYKSLPVAGISGTMQTIGAGTKLHGNLRAKTGSMSQVYAFSGYFTGASGKMYSFCLVANRFTGKTSYIAQKLTEILQAAQASF